LQELLATRGFDVGTADGAIGPRTRAAIRAFQASAGLPEDGHPGMKALDALKAKAQAPQAKESVR